MEKHLVYLDYNASTPLDSEVKAAFIDALDVYANASSMHEEGRRASLLIEKARLSINELLGIGNTGNLYFTSGGSESNNTVFNTAFLLARQKGKTKIITTAIEHPCVLNAAKFLQTQGFTVVFLPVDEYGVIDIELYKKELDNSTYLVSIMMANNEIGTIQDIKTLSSLAHEKGAYFHTDATQAIGKIMVDVKDLDVDYLTLSCHKLYGPKGVGALYIKTGSPLEPLIRGGHQEHGFRAGTYNNANIIAFGKAAEIAKRDFVSLSVKMATLREKLRKGLIESIPKIRINGHPTMVLPNTLNISFPGAEGESILLYLDLEGIEVSTGSACASGSLDPSHVLMATGVGPELAHGSIRFSMGKNTTSQDIDFVLEKLPPIIKKLRDMSTVAY